MVDLVALETRRTEYIMITFDGKVFEGLGTTTLGGFYVMEAAGMPPGYELPPREV
jgi:hypothetical protein